MIASWMAYAALMGLLLTLAAVALEHVAAARRWPARHGWAAALVLSIAWPVGSAVMRLWPRPAPDIMPFMITVLPLQVIRDGPAGIDGAELLSRALIACWIAASTFLLLRLGHALVGLRRARGGWRRDELDGTAVRLAPNAGPAVIGLRSMEIVLPEWVAALDTHLRELVLRHEEEHRRARDPHLLFAAAVAVALMPWNIALWIQARRLRLAIELDCDARVLRAHPTPERYGLLMLTIAQRRSIAPALYAPMLTEPATQLERRIVAMGTTSRRVVRATVLGGAAAFVAVLFACTLKSDSVTSPTAAGQSLPATTTKAASGPRLVTEKDTFREFQVERPAELISGGPAPRYPAMLRSAKVEGGVLAAFVVDTTGLPIPNTLKVLKSTHELFTDAVRNSLPMLRFTPARVGGRKVKQLVQMPFQFNLSNGTGDTAIAPVGGIHVVGVPATELAHRGMEPVAVMARGASAAPRAGLTEVPVAREPVTNLPPGIFLEFQVDKAVSPRAGNPAPRYPDMLRDAKIEGEVLAQFVVDENGMPDMSTFRALKSTHELFTATVQAALPNDRFYPAELKGRKVKQLVQMPFQFSLTKAP